MPKPNPPTSDQKEAWEKIRKVYKGSALAIGDMRFRDGLETHQIVKLTGKTAHEIGGCVGAIARHMPKMVQRAEAAEYTAPEAWKDPVARLSLTRYQRDTLEKIFDLGKPVEQVAAEMGTTHTVIRRTIAFALKGLANHAERNRKLPSEVKEPEKPSTAEIPPSEQGDDMFQRASFNAREADQIVATALWNAAGQKQARVRTTPEFLCKYTSERWPGMTLNVVKASLERLRIRSLIETTGAFSGDYNLGYQMEKFIAKIQNESAIPGISKLAAPIREALNIPVQEEKTIFVVNEIPKAETAPQLELDEQPAKAAAPPPPAAPPVNPLVPVEQKSDSDIATVAEGMFKLIGAALESQKYQAEVVRLTNELNNLQGNTLSQDELMVLGDMIHLVDTIKAITDPANPYSKILATMFEKPIDPKDLDLYKGVLSDIYNRSHTR